MTITWRWAARSARATPAICGLKARTTWSPTATYCTSASRRERSDGFAAIADRAEVFVDAEHDEDKLGEDAREDDGGQHAGDAQDRRDEAGDRAIGHHPERRDHAREPA